MCGVTQPHDWCHSLTHVAYWPQPDATFALGRTGMRRALAPGFVASSAVNRLSLANDLHHRHPVSTARHGRAD